MDISIQLYSLREFVKDEGIEAVIKKVGKSGFTGVETAGFYGWGFFDFKKLLDDNGLKVTGAHIDTRQLTETPDVVKEMTDVLEFKNIINPAMPLNTEFDKTVETLRSQLDFARKNGLVFGYHNHAHEFDGKDWLKDMLSAVPGIKLELDLFWLKVAGKDFTEYYQNTKADYITFHLKELSADGVQAPNPFLGEGISNLSTAIAAAKKANFDHLVVEVERMAVDYPEYLANAATFIKNELKK